MYSARQPHESPTGSKRYVVEFHQLATQVQRRLGEMLDFAEAGAGLDGYSMSTLLLSKKCQKQSEQVICFHFSDPMLANVFALLFGGRCRDGGEVRKT